MSATFNWAYRPGVTNKYGLTVPAGADNVRPTGWCYVALFGNDATGNGSRQYPYKTILKALSLGGSLNIVIGSGTYREHQTSIFTVPTGTLIGDGDVILDVTYYGLIQTGSVNSFSLYNIKAVGNGTGVLFGGDVIFKMTDCYFDGCLPTSNFWHANTGSFISFCVFANFSNTIGLNNFQNTGRLESCTFVNCNAVLIDFHSACIFYRCNIRYMLPVSGYPRYSIFYQCNFSTTVSTPGALYPSVSTGWTYYSDIDALKIAAQAAFPTLTNLFQNCIMADPKFNNTAIGDYTLTFDSPAKNLSYFGTYVGASSIAQSLKIRATESAGDFDFSTAINVTIADNSLTLTDPSQDGIIETMVISNLLGREIKRIPCYGFNADRNGQYIDSIKDLSDITYATGDTLPANMPFLVEVGAITYNGSVYQAGERGTTISTATTFTSTASGVIREIIEAPQRHTVEMKCGDSQPFTDEVWAHYDPSISPTTNNIGDSRTGAIIRGNGDPAYVRGGLSIQEFPINTKYIKIRFTIRANNLKP